MDDFFYEYFVSPILEKSGYNIVNTFAYALIALVLLYAIWVAFRRMKLKIGSEFFLGVFTFVLFGSTMRVVTDAVDSGVFQPVSPLHSLVLDSGLYGYGFLTVSPGTYVVVAVAFLVSLLVLHSMKRMELLKYVGLAFFLFHFMLLLPFIQHAALAVPVLVLAAIPFLAALWYFRAFEYAAVVGGHALDGAATFFIIDIYPAVTGIHYFEQHVMPRAIAEFFGTYFAFYLVKIAIAALAAYVVSKEKMDKGLATYVLAVFMVAGLAPGVRDVLRMVVGA